MIDIIDLHVRVGDKLILKGVHLSIRAGQVHALMGPNGSGKSTLSRVLAGHPSYTITQGEIWFQNRNLAALSPEERAHAGLFVSFQYPVEIAGVSNQQFLQAAVQAHRKGRNEAPLTDACFAQLMQEKMTLLEMKEFFKERNVNEGFSGGEKKRNEILQMALLSPAFAVLDETDSGLDIDALRLVAQGINHMRSPDKAFLLITHYQRLLDLVIPDFVHVLVDGTIIRSGDARLAQELEAKGYVLCNS